LHWRGAAHEIPRSKTMFERARPRPGVALAAALPLAAVACLPGGDPDPADLGQREEALASDVAGAGPDSGVEWSIDAPWRMEPVVTAGGDRLYDPIPITLTFHDMDMQDPARPLPIRRFCSAHVLALQPGAQWPNASLQTVFPHELHEIEAAKRWTAAGILEPVPAGQANHVVRRIWNGDAPDDALDLGQWAEWHASFTYQPGAIPVGQDLRLIVLARVSRGSSCTDVSLHPAQLMYQLKKGRISKYPPLPGPVRDALDSLFFGDFLRVHYASQPLPRFDDRWVYGDLHYHSQGTDNEGESAINFRGVLAAMKAMGLDYAFATDHTSGSTQVSGLASFYVDNLRPVPIIGSIDFLRERLEAKLAGLVLPVVQRDALRDLNAARFRHLRALLNDPGGANAQVLSTGGLGRAPQLFLGGEVDVIPEMSAEDASRGGFPYGIGRRYRWSDPCDVVSRISLPWADLGTLTTWDELCPPQMITHGSAHDRRSIRDVQGPLEIGYFARQHLLHLPVDPADDGQVIIGNTSPWGGASLSLQAIVDDHLGAQQKGYAFLAHPVEADHGDAVTRLGPDLVPYSRAQLEVAFASPYVLGLQLWNENDRVASTAPEHRPPAAGSQRRFPFLHRIGTPLVDPGFEDWILSAQHDWRWEREHADGLYHALRHGAAMWDEMNLWGITPARTTAIGLGPDQFRKVFMAGGSDAHGDLNYRRHGRFFGWSHASDTAIGSPRNLTYVGTERSGRVDDGGSGRPTLGQRQVVDALRTGRFSVTDGPALRIAIDRNGNGVIDDADVQMGEDFTIGGAQTAPLLVEWKSTEEFGPVQWIDLFVGVQAGSREGLVYGPLNAPCVESLLPIKDAAGNAYCPMTDGYVRGDHLRITVAGTPGVTAYAGTVRVDLDPRALRLFDLECGTIEIPVPSDSGGDGSEQRITCSAKNVADPERLFVRARANSKDWIDGFPVHRYAYTNPIWLRSRPLPGLPAVALAHTQCVHNVNSFTATVSTTGSVPVTSLQRQFKIGSGSWTTLSSTTITAAAGQIVYLRARACNGDGCSAYATTSRTGASSCPPPVPRAPSVHLEHTGCSSGVNRFLATVSATGSVPATSLVKEYRIGSGAWASLAGSQISAGSQQSVSVRGKACNPHGCSAFTTRSQAGPTCTTGGGGTHPK
jgi:hypothetical protein